MPLLVEAREAQQQADPRPGVAKLSGAYLIVGLKLQEASMAASDIGRKLSDAVSAAHQGTGKYAYYTDHMGDGESGDVIYECSGDTMSCPYEMQDNGDGVAPTANLDLDSAKKVQRTVSYLDVPDETEAAHYSAMSEAWKRDRIYSSLPLDLYERFVSKGERDKMDASDFAGKGKSFPINKPADVMAALHSIGRAGPGNYGPAKLRANILAIAKRKGFPLPKSAKEDASEAARHAAGGLRLVESAATLETIVLREARADYPIKLIAPGKGASAFYPADVLKRDGPKVFAAGTHVYLNHATAAEEAARPEGDVRNLAGVLTSAAEYRETDPKGPGLYARMKVFADHAQTVEEKAPHVGMSIRASGVAESGGKLRDGLPVLKELTSAESVDVVTRPGAGGMILTEAARHAVNTQEASMDAEELKLLRESVARLSGKETRREAIQEGARILRDVSLPDAAKEYVIETVLKESLPMKDGALDITKFTEAVNAEARRFGAAIGAGPGVTGMGAAAAVVEITEAQRKAQADAEKADEAMCKESWATLLDGDTKLADIAVRGAA